MKEGKDFAGFDSSGGLSQFLNNYQLIINVITWHPEQWGLVLAGDRSGDARNVSRVESTNDGVVFGSLVDLPSYNSYSCMAIIDEDRLFVCGGMSNPSETLVFSKSQNFWFRYFQPKKGGIAQCTCKDKCKGNKSRTSTTFQETNYN